MEVEERGNHPFYPKALTGRKKGRSAIPVKVATKMTSKSEIKVLIDGKTDYETYRMLTRSTLIIKKR